MPRSFGGILVLPFYGAYGPKEMIESSMILIQLFLFFGEVSFLALLWASTLRAFREQLVYRMFIQIGEQCVISFSLFYFLHFFEGFLVLLLYNSSSFIKRKSSRISCKLDLIPKLQVFYIFNTHKFRVVELFKIEVMCFLAFLTWPKGIVDPCAGETLVIFPVSYMCNFFLHYIDPKKLGDLNQLTQDIISFR